MKVRLLRIETIERFVEDHANSRILFDNWLNKIEYADWEKPLDITNTCKGNLLNDKRLVFDIGGNGRNAYRMICTFIFGRKYVRLYINWVDTHEEYNRLNNEDKLTVWSY